MKCIFCGCKDSKVVDSRYLKDSSIRRRRECEECGKRFTTYETVESNPMIVTNVENIREPFKIEKLTDSVRYATYCCDIESEHISEIVADIEKKLLAMQRQEIETKDIVLTAIDVLAELDVMASLVYYIQHSNCATFDGIRRFINR